MQNFRHISNNSQILFMLKNAPAVDIGEIWQTRPDKRYHYKISTLKDDENKKAIVFEIKGKLDFSSKFPVYVRINHSDLIFKLEARSFVVSDNKLACLYPKMARALDKRGVERVPLPEHKEITVMLSPLGLGLQDMKVRLFDISKKGIGILITEQNKEYLKRNVRFRITAINDIHLSGEHITELRYIQKPFRGFVRAGLGLQKQFTEEVYTMITKVIFSNYSDNS